MIKPDYLTVDELLSKRLFRIPDYQRAYSWKRNQRLDLFNDIKKLKQRTDPDRSHFLATIVLMKTNDREEVGPDEFQIYDIVDGQQRLTTIVILLKAITKLLQVGDDDQRRYGGDLQSLLVKRENRRLILLQTNHESSHEFRRYLEDGTIPSTDDLNTTGQKNLADAFKECELFAQEWREGATDLLRLIKNKLAFVNYVLDDQISAYTIFEVLNSRGLPVDSLDKCKSMLMALAYERIEENQRQDFTREIHQLWTSLYREIGVDEVSGNEILRFSAALLSTEPQGKVMSDEEALTAIRQTCENDTSQIIATVTEFVKIAKIIKSIKEKPTLDAVVSNRQSRFLYTAINAAIHLNDREKNSILEIWEKVTFLIYGIFRRDTRYEVGALVKLGWRIVNESLSVDQVISALKKIGAGYIDDRRSIASELGNIDCYNQWTEQLRYFLYKYEAYLAEQAGYSLPQETWEMIWSVSPSKSIEHILPQNTEADGWSGVFGNKEEAQQWLHRLGNLLIVTPNVNSKLSDHTFGIKKEIYTEECSHFRLIREVSGLDEWNPQLLEERELRMLEWAENYWKVC